MILGLLITIVAIVVGIRVYVLFQDNMKFFVTGKDKGFKINEINLLWKLAKRLELEEPESLYISTPSLTSAIQVYTSQVKAENREDDPEVQEFLSKLYKYRTKIDIDRDNSKGLDTTRALSEGQKIRIILPGSGVFTSSIVQSGREILIKLPMQKNLYMLSSDKWVGKDVSVYLWRKGDAGYVFDTRVLSTGVFNGSTVLVLAETDKLIRTQKRKSVRCQCNLLAQMYFLTDDNIDFSVVESAPGFKCRLEDISEDGALIRIGGKAVTGIQLKIQFELGEKFIVMFGVARAVEYDIHQNQSLIHYECLHLENDMRNHILSFVYNILPPDKKEVLEALSQTEEDAKGDEEFKETDVSGNNDAELLEAKPVDMGDATLMDFEEKPEEVNYTDHSELKNL